MKEKVGAQSSALRWNTVGSSRIDDLDFFIGDEALSPAAANYSVKVGDRLLTRFLNNTIVFSLQLSFMMFRVFSLYSVTELL